MNSNFVAKIFILTLNPLGILYWFKPLFQPGTYLEIEMRICNLMHMSCKIVYCKEHAVLRKRNLEIPMSTWTLLEISCLVSFFYPFLRKFFESKRDKWSRGSLHSLCIKCRSLQKVVRFLWIKKQERIMDFRVFFQFSLTNISNS